MFVSFDPFTYKLSPTAHVSDSLVPVVSTFFRSPYVLIVPLLLSAMSVAAIPNAGILVGSSKSATITSGVFPLCPLMYTGCPAVIVSLALAVKCCTPKKSAVTELNVTSSVVEFG